VILQTSSKACFLAYLVKIALRQAHPFEAPGHHFNILVFPLGQRFSCGEIRFDLLSGLGIEGAEHFAALGV